MKAKFLFTTVLVFVMQSIAAADTVHASKNTYENITGDFSSVDSYHYSSGDIENKAHTLIFCIDSDVIYADGKETIIDEAPYISEGRTMLPLRAVIETFNTFNSDVNISWDSQNKQVRTRFQDKEAVFTVGSNVYELNGVSKKMDGGMPVLKNGRTFVPLRVIAESMGLNVSWNDKDRTITVTNG